MLSLVPFTPPDYYSEEEDEDDVHSDHLTEGSGYLLSRCSECREFFSEGMLRILLWVILGNWQVITQ